MLTADITRPGVQKPHCSPCSCEKALGPGEIEPIAKKVREMGSRFDAIGNQARVYDELNRSHALIA